VLIQASGDKKSRSAMAETTGGRRRDSNMRKQPILTALRRAANSESLSAAFILGRLYDEGWGLRTDARAAYHWYKRAAEGGLPQAFYFAASAYYYGAGVKKNKTRAYDWFRRAAEVGDLDGCYMEAVCLIDGSGVSPDANRGFRLLRQAATKGSADAMDYLAAHFIKLGKPTQAFEWANRATRAGDRIAATRLPEIKRLAAKTHRRSNRSRQSRAGERRGRPS
jgi:TPR repeat protein